SGLARAFGVPEQAWVDANPGRFPTRESRDLIRIGERLAIPAEWDDRYRVQPGDTFDEIAARLGVDPDRLAEAQGGRFPTRASRDHIGEGERFVVPGTPAADDRTTPTPAPTPTPTPNPTPTPPPNRTPKPTPSGTPGATTAPAQPPVAAPDGGGWTVLGIGALLATGVAAAVLGVRAVVRHRSTVRGWPGQLRDRWRASGLHARAVLVPGQLRDLRARAAARGRAAVDQIGRG